MSAQTTKTIGLVLSGGGARGAYQVGVLSAIAEISRELGLQNPFQIYTGVSAGAINASFLAAGADDFVATTKKLVDLWSQITSEQVFYTDALSLGLNGFKWLEDFSFGGLKKSPKGKSLLNTAPLSELLQKNISFSKIQEHIDQKILRGVAVTAMDYNDMTGVTFVQGPQEITMWSKARRKSQSAALNTEHIMASAAIPMLFPPIAVDNKFYGDGCIRNQSPCGPAIYMGADNLIVIGVRMDLHKQHAIHMPALQEPPSVAKVVNVLLNAVMLDGIEPDLERLKHANQIAEQFSNFHSKESIRLKKINYSWISPSEDIGAIARTKANKLPRLIRYLLKGLGTIEDAQELVSYLLFEPGFCTQLIEIGFEDGMNQKEEIKTLLMPS